MNFLCIGDLHVRISEFYIIDSIQSQIVNIIKSHLPKYCVIMGDVLHNFEKIHTLEMNRAQEFIGEISEFVPTFVLVGNHDYIKNNQFLTTNHWMNALKKWKNVTICDNVIEIEDGRVIFVPFVPTGRFAEAVGNKRTVGAHLVFAHQEFRGADLRGRESTEGDIWTGLGEVISGHIHTNQTIREGIHQGPVRYIGTPQQCGLTIIELDSQGGVILKKVSLNVPKVAIFNVSVEEVKKLCAPINSKVYIRDTLDNFKKFKCSSEYIRLASESRVFFIANSPEPTRNWLVEEIDMKNCDFISELENKVATEADSYLYCAAKKVIYNTVENEKDHLFIKHG